MEGTLEALKDIPKLGHLPKNVCSSNVNTNKADAWDLQLQSHPYEAGSHQSLFLDSMGKPSHCCLQLVGAVENCLLLLHTEV